MTILKDPERLSYANKDLFTIDADIERYITAFIPTIKGMTVSNEGRMVIRILEALVDMLNYSVDMQQRESNIETVLQEENILRLVKLIGYKKAGPSGSLADCTFTMASGVAPIGGQAIPLWTALQKSASPNMSFVIIEAATIPEGDASLAGVAAIQGYAVSGESLTAAASGDPNQTYTIANAKVVEDQLSVFVAGVLWTKVDNFWDSAEGDLHYYVTYDEEYNCTVYFGDGEFGAIPGAGVAITCSYVYTDGEGYDVGAEEIDTVGGALATVVVVSNPIESSGGSDGDSVEDIRVKAPEAFSTLWRGVTKTDLEVLAREVDSVFSAKVKTPYGNSITVYILPEGGGTASASLLSDVEDHLTERSVLQGTITAESVEYCEVRINCHVVARTNRISKSLLRRWVITALTNAFTYDQFDVGYGFTVSEVGDFILQYQDNTVFKAVDFTLLSRWPRVEKSNVAAPDMNGNVFITPTVGYDTWVLTATTVAEYQVAKNGILQTVSGTVGVSYTSDNDEVSFTLGVVTDVLAVGDIWMFKTSKYAGNLLVDENEHMYLDESDLEVHVYYPGEYDATQ